MKPRCLKGLMCNHSEIDNKYMGPPQNLSARSDDIAAATLPDMNFNKSSVVVILNSSCKCCNPTPAAEAIVIL